MPGSFLFQLYWLVIEIMSFGWSPFNHFFIEYHKKGISFHCSYSIQLLKHFHFTDCQYIITLLLSVNYWLTQNVKLNIPLISKIMEKKHATTLHRSLIYQ